MTRIRYAARSEEELAAARTGGPLPDIWSTGVAAVWETDPDAVAAVLPPPLKPAEEPLVRLNISQVDLLGSPLGAGSVSVLARHGDRVGWYALVMPMSTERALVSGREVFGEPKKLGEVTVDRDGDRVLARMVRHGIAFAEVDARVGGQLPLPEESESLAFYFKVLPAVDGKGLDGTGLDGDPLLVHCLRRERVRRLESLTGEVVLRESPYDPVADLPVRRLRELTIGEKTSDQRGRVAERVSAQALLPYLHQRYDDPQQITDAPPNKEGRA